ncbi:hypothetical protein [Nocardioides pacificus]
MAQTSSPTQRPDLAQPPAPWAYLWWAVTGALLAFGVVGILTIGVVLLAIAVGLALVGARWTPLRNRSVVALVGGLSAAPLSLAWLNREGPGTVCETLRDDVTQCTERWSPWPFLAVAAVLLAITLTVLARRGSRGSSRTR